MNESIILEARELAFMERMRPESSKIWHLSDELFTEAVKAYIAGVSFAKIRAMLADAGILESDLPSQAAWVKFLKRFKPFLRLARRHAAAEGASATAAEARKAPADFEEACLDLVQQLAFELVDSEAADPQEVSTLVRLVLRYKDQKLKERLVQVAERRVALAEQRQAGTTTTGGTGNGTAMDPEERERRIREIFGLSSEGKEESGVGEPHTAAGQGLTGGVGATQATSMAEMDKGINTLKHPKTPRGENSAAYDMTASIHPPTPSKRSFAEGRAFPKPHFENEGMVNGINTLKRPKTPREQIDFGDGVLKGDGAAGGGGYYNPITTFCKWISRHLWVAAYFFESACRRGASPALDTSAATTPADLDAPWPDLPILNH